MERGAFGSELDSNPAERRGRWRLEIIGYQGRLVVGERYGARSVW